jgi:hypothetical protein
MLSGAKHLLVLKETSKSRSFAAAQDDKIGGVFPQPAKLTGCGKTM